MQSGPLSRGGRVLVRGELSLLELSRWDRVCVQAVCRHRAGQAQSRRGADRLLVWGDDTANHTRCGVCGSLLYSVVRDGAYVHVAMGSLEDNPSISPTEHIFVGSKAPWFNITDDLPQLEEYQGHARPRFQAAPRRRTARERRRSAFGMGCSRNQAPTVIAPCRGGYPLGPRACARWEEVGVRGGGSPTTRPCRARRRRNGAGRRAGRVE